MVQSQLTLDLLTAMITPAVLISALTERTASRVSLISSTEA